MQFITYALASLLSFLGLAIGIGLVHIAPEEQHPLKKYIHLLQQLLLVSIMLFLSFFFIKDDLMIFLLIIVLALGALFLKRRKKLNTLLIYPVLGLLLYLSSKNENLFLIESLLFLLYGMSVGILLTKQNKKNHFSLILRHSSFLLVAVLLFFLNG